MHKYIRRKSDNSLEFLVRRLTVKLADDHKSRNVPIKLMIGTLNFLHSSELSKDFAPNILPFKSIRAAWEIGQQDALGLSKPRFWRQKSTQIKVRPPTHKSIEIGIAQWIS